MATKKELLETRKELNTKTQLLYQAEVCNTFQWISGYLQHLKTPNDTTDFKLALIKDAMKIWDTGIYSNENLKSLFQDTSKIGGGWEDLMKGWLEVKKTGKLTDANYNAYKDKRALPYIYDDFNEYISELESVKPFAEKYEILYNYWRDNLKSIFDNKPLYPDGYKLAKAKFQLLIDVKEEWDKHFLTPYSDLSVEALVKIKTDLDKLKVWTDAFPNKQPNEISQRPDIAPSDFQKLQESQEKHTKAEIDKLNEIKDAYNGLVDYWNNNDDFKTFFNEKPLSLDGLGEVKKLIKLAKKVKEIEDYWLSIDFVNQFGEISVESLDKIKGKLDELKTWTDTFVSLTPQTVKEKYNEPKEVHTDYDKIKGELDNYIGILKIIDPDERNPSSESLKQWTTSKITEVYKKNEEMGKKDDEIARLKGEIVKLKKQPEEHLSKLIKTYKEQVAEETEMFYQSLDLDEVDDIRPEYVGNYLKYLNRINGETDPDNLINAFKLVVLAIATEKAKKISDKWINEPIAKEVQFRKSKIEYFNRILRQWEIHWGLNPTFTNNPLLIATSREKTDDRKIIRDLLIEWWKGTPRTTTRSIPNPMLKTTIELDTFPITKTSFGLLREVLNRKNRMTDYIQDLKELSPEIKSAVEVVEAEHVDRLNSLSTETKYTSFQIYFDYFNKRNSILNEVKTTTIKSLTELFKEKEKDGEVRKFLKQVAIEQTPSWEAQINSWQAGVAGLLFMRESMEEFYLGHLIIHIKDNLNIVEPVKLEEIKEPLKKILTDKPNGIFTVLYSGFVSTDKQRDLEDFEKGINRKLKDIETLIEETRKNKGIKEHQEKDKQYLTKLLEVYREQIKKETEVFYSIELGLDESENINPKYWGNEGTEEEPNNEKSYLEKLSELNGDSEPQQIINAFKFVALISATERALKNSDSLRKDPKVFNNKKIRASTLKEFSKIKDCWDELGEAEPNKNNNPLYLSRELDKTNLETWKNKLNEIIILWQ